MKHQMEMRKPILVSFYDQQITQLRLRLLPYPFQPSRDLRG